MKTAQISTLLEYTFTTDPSPLEGNQKAGITVAGKGEEMCNRCFKKLEIKITDAEKRLSANIKAGEIVVNGTPAGLEGEQRMEGNDYYYSYNLMDYRPIHSIEFTLTTIGNSTSYTGEIEMLLTETAKKESNGQYEERDLKEKIMKVTDQFYLQNFIGIKKVEGQDQPCLTFKNGETFELTWDSNGTEYELYQDDKLLTPAPEGPYWKVDGLNKNANFIVVAKKDALRLYSTLNVIITKPEVIATTLKTTKSDEKGEKSLLIGNTKNNDPTINSEENSWLRMGAKEGIALWANGKVKEDDSPMLLVNPDKVGIGTTKPEAKLDVNGNVKSKSLDVGNLPEQNGTIGIGWGNSTPKWTIETQSLRESCHDHGYQGPLIFKTKDGHEYCDPLAEKMRITHDGKVGIGTADPKTKLHVAGTVKARALKIGKEDNSPMLFVHPDRVGIGTGAPNPNALLECRGPLMLSTVNATENEMKFTREILSERFCFVGFPFGLPDSTNNLKLSLVRKNVSGTDPAPDYELRIGHPLPDVFFGRTGKRFEAQLRIRSNGDAHVRGTLWAQNLIIRSGSKPGFVVDHFINRVGAPVEQGDVVVIAKNKISHYCASQNNIPIPEVDLTNKAYDTCVCGIVTQVLTDRNLPFVEEMEEKQLEILAKKRAEAEKAGKGKQKRKSKPKPYVHPLKKNVPEFSEEIDLKKVEDKQMGSMAILGCYAHCKVDADIAPIKIGDLLTTSPTKGHAQKVLEPEKAIGAIIGKALGSLNKGKGRIPVMVMMQIIATCDNNS